MMNLFGLDLTMHVRLRVRCFLWMLTLKYTKHRDVWILLDSTGLKGSAAHFDQWRGESAQRICRSVPTTCTIHNPVAFRPYHGKRDRPAS